MSKPKGNILIVDDTPENLNVLRQLLVGQGYRVRPALSGEIALKAIDKDRPDLILLDIMMPGLDGYEVCRRLKKSKSTKGIPVIFITALSEVEDEEKGFALGAVDYITKPFKTSIVLARVKTQLELQRARQRQKELLEKTVTGVISLLVDILALAYPEIFKRSSRVKGYIQNIADHLNLPNAWQYKLAGLLSQIGCITLSAKTFKKYCAHDKLTREEQLMVDNHPRVGSELVAKVPHLKKIGEMIGLQDIPFSDPRMTNYHTEVRTGAQILSVVLGFDHMVGSGFSQAKAKAQLRENPLYYAPDIVDAFELVISQSTQDSKGVSQKLDISGLYPGMILDADIKTADRKCLLARGFELTMPAISLLRYYAESGKLSGQIKVISQ